jgi:hypothetical protein
VDEHQTPAITCRDHCFVQQLVPVTADVRRELWVQRHPVPVFSDRGRRVDSQHVPVPYRTDQGKVTVRSQDDAATQDSTAVLGGHRRTSPVPRWR